MLPSADSRLTFTVRPPSCRVHTDKGVDPIPSSPCTSSAKSQYVPYKTADDLQTLTGDKHTMRQELGWTCIAEGCFIRTCA